MFCDYGMSCDYNTCSYCNPVVRTKEEELEKTAELIKRNSNKSKSILQKILTKKDEFTLPGTIFYLQHYLRYGYEIGDNILIHFIKDKNKNGILKNEDKTEYWIYHDGNISENDKYSSLYLCPYTFETNKESVNHIKFLEKDDIFEEYVHKGFGFYINHTEIEKLQAE